MDIANGPWCNLVPGLTFRNLSFLYRVFERVANPRREKGGEVGQILYIQPSWSLERGSRQVPICDERPMEFDNSNAGREARI